MKKQICLILLLLVLFSLPAAWAMDFDERKDDGLDITGPDYSQCSDVKEEYVSVDSAMNMFSENQLLCALECFHLPKVIVDLIAKYAEKENGYDSCDMFINDTPLYAYKVSSIEQSLIKKYFYQKLQEALIKEQLNLGLPDASTSGIPLSDALMIGDSVWLELLKTKPFQDYDMRRWAFSSDKEKIITVFPVDKALHCIIYDIAKNTVLDLGLLHENDSEKWDYHLLNAAREHGLLSLETF